MPDDSPLIGPHGGFRDLKAYQLAEIIHDGTVAFCRRAFPARSRTAEQMISAARSGKQNIAEGSADSATSKKIELKLTATARGSLIELQLDFEDYLRQNGLSKWTKESEKAKFIRKLTLKSEKPNPDNPDGGLRKSYAIYKPYIEEKSLETAANTLICLIYQATYLLYKLLQKQEKDFTEKGGFTEKMYKTRKKRTEKQSPN